MHNASKHIPLIVNTMSKISKRGILSITMNTPNPNSVLLVPFSFDDTANNNDKIHNFCYLSSPIASTSELAPKVFLVMILTQTYCSDMRKIAEQLPSLQLLEDTDRVRTTSPFSPKNSTM